MTRMILGLSTIFAITMSVGCPGTMDDGNLDTDGGTEDMSVPSDYDGFVAWAADMPYAGWRAESAPHVSAASGAHTGQVQTYINDAMEQALDDGSTDFPVGAASIKELYNDAGDTLLGYAVMVKTADNAGTEAGDWWRMVDTDLLVEGGDGAANAMGSGADVGCMACHDDGVDYFKSDYPAAF